MLKSKGSRQIWFELVKDDSKIKTKMDEFIHLMIAIKDVEKPYKVSLINIVYQQYYQFFDALDDPQKRSFSINVLKGFRRDYLP